MNRTLFRLLDALPAKLPEPESKTDLIIVAKELIEDADAKMYQEKWKRSNKIEEFIMG